MDIKALALQQQTIKVEALKQVYHNWGVILRRALREASPVDRGTLRSSIQFRVIAPRNSKDITGTVRLLVGVLDPDSPVLRYIRDIVEGSPRHFVGVKTSGGRFTGILGWAKRHGLTYYGPPPGGNGEDATRWAVGKSRGKKFTGLFVQHKGNDMFNVIYRKYETQIMDDVKAILGS